MSQIGYTVDFVTFLRIVPFVFAEAKPVILRGRHGIGKSELVYEIGKTLKLPVIERRASQMTEGDLVGLPTVNGDRTRFNPPDWFKEACEKPALLFLDEIDRATIEVRQGIFELTDSRKLNGHTLHPGTRIFAAVNGGKHAQQYQVGEMDPAELDRWSVFDVEPSAEDWLKWADGKVHKIIWDFINQNHVHLECKEDFEPNKKYPSRRSWKRCSDVISSAKLLDGEYTHDIVPLVNAFCGMEAALNFGKFVETLDRQVTPEDIIVNGKFDMVKKHVLNDHLALIEKMISMKTFEVKLGDKEIKNLAKYFVMLPSEACMKLFKSLGAGGIKENNINFYKQDVEIVNDDGKKEKVPLATIMVKILQPAATAQAK